MAIFRSYNKETDLEAARRIWKEVGWLQSDENFEALMEARTTRGPAHIAELNGSAECMVLTAPGNLRYLEADVPFSGIMTVITSHLARKQGIASRLTAKALAMDAAAGAMVSGLGMFEQGFYNQLGFGSGVYEHFVSFDPAQLVVSVEARPPRRITPDHWKEVHASRLARMRRHGSVCFDSPEATRAGLLYPGDKMGLGYFDGPDGALTHHLYGDGKGAHGPYRVFWMSYQTPGQFLELMALLRNLGDQVRLVTMMEPPGIQLQDMVQQPIRWRQLTEKSPYQARIDSMAEWQMRICDLEGCLEKTKLAGEEVRFNLHLTDPIERFLDNDAPWKGVGGDYVVTLGPSSGAARGVDSMLPRLTATVNVFTRLWLGVRPATGLAITDDLFAPEELLARLDRCLRLPAPKPDWSF